jgi:hypothetical protein
MRATARVGIAVCAFSLGHAALAQPDYGYEWVTIGNPGNRDTLPHEVPKDPGLRIGGVSYKYRMARTEVTVGEWFTFVNAYHPYWKGSKNSMGLTGFWIYPTSNDPDDPQYEMTPGSENRPTNMSWHAAACYVNWLCNGKGTEQSDFEIGAYDASTFTENEDDTWNDQAEHTPGSAFWIPTLDEHTKALYYDPDRYGSGQEGYWEYCDGGNEQLIEDWPWNGGETSAGIDYEHGMPWLDVGAYPHVQTPWGLLDASGGEEEWLEDQTGDKTGRFLRGRDQFDGSPYFFDRVDYLDARPPVSHMPGLRLASIVPAPGPVLVPLMVGSHLIKRRR